MGLSKQYTLASDLWKKIEPTPKSFRDTVGQMQTRAFQVNQLQHGFLILDHRGNPLGIWYSILPATTVIQMLDQQRVIIYTPDVKTYIKYEDREGSGR